MPADETEATWKSIAEQKQAQRDAAIYPEWRVNSKYLSDNSGKPENVLKVPDQCGILTPQECHITTQYDSVGLLEQISSRRLTTREVALAFCKRAAIAQQLTNCLTEPLFTWALRRAETLDQYQIEHGRPSGPLHGLPVSLKDSFNIAGVDSSLGLAALCFKPAKSSSPLVDLLLSLGCVIIAKTNVPQAVASPEGTNNVFGRTLNPINRLVTASGSSSGEGALLAMRGSMIGVGTDIGGSIRTPAMCNGLYGIKPSVGRVPYEGQETGGFDGAGRVALQAAAGPIAQSMQDLNTFLKEVMPRAEMWGADCVPGTLDTQATGGSGKNGALVIGVLRSDGNCEPLPPILRALDEVKFKLGRAGGAEVIEIPTPSAWRECQNLWNQLQGAPGTFQTCDLIEQTGEPLVPWMRGRFKRSGAVSFEEMSRLQAQRSEVERQMLEIWYSTDANGSKRRRVDAIICPVAPHPAPPVDSWNTLNYTSSFVLLDYPAGVLPVRSIKESDLELGKEISGEPLGSWDKQNRQLWDEKAIDRRLYLGTSLSVQVVVPRLRDWELCRIMEAVDQVLNSTEHELKL